jgi:chromosome segregation ATPase
MHSNFKTKQKQVTESLDRQLMKSESKLNDFEDEFSSLTSENASLSKKLRGALTDNERLSKQLESLKSDNNKLIHENDNLVNENDSLVKELKIARNDNDNLSKQIKSRDNLTEKLISKSDKLKDDISVKSEKENKLQEQLKKSSDRITYLETQLENISKTHQEDISSMDNEVEEYNRLLNEAQSKLDNSNNTVKELKESLSQTEKTLASSQNRNKQLLEGIKKYQEKYLNKVASVAGVNSNSLKQSISYETTPDQIDSLVESLRDRIDRHNKLGLSKNNLNINSDYVVATNKQGSDDNSEDSKLLSFLTTTQVSL